MDMVEKIKQLLLFKGVSDEDNHNTPQVTMGTIVWGILLRIALIVLPALYLLQTNGRNEVWYIVLFLIWFLALYPGYVQFQKYQERITKFEESTLCGSCRHFSPESQLCKIYDVHVNTNYIPCEGEDWEPKI